MDASAMKTLFKDLNFILCEHRNLTVDQMVKVFKYNVSMYEEDAYCRGCNFTAFAACIITKGGESKKDLYGASNTAMGMQNIIEIMTEFPSFKIIPKVVIFQFYRGTCFKNFGKYFLFFSLPYISFKCPLNQTDWKGKLTSINVESNSKNTYSKFLVISIFSNKWKIISNFASVFIL